MRAVAWPVARSVAERVRVVAARFPHRSRAEIARAFGVSRQVVAGALANRPHRSPEVKEGWRAMLQWGATLEEIGTASHLSRERVRQVVALPKHERTRATLAHDPVRVLAAARAPSVTRLAHVHRQLGHINIWPVLDALGVSAAVRRLWRIRRERPKWARQREIVTKLQGEAERLGRIPTLREMAVCLLGRDYGPQSGALVVGYWSPHNTGRCGGLAAIRRAAGFPVTGRGRRFVKHGAVRDAIRRLAGQSGGMSAKQLVRATGTSLASAKATISIWRKRGDLRVRERLQQHRQPAIYELTAGA